MPKKILLFLVIPVLLAPVFYFYFQYFYGFLQFAALATAQDQESQRALEEGTKKSKELYNQERVVAINTIYNDVPLIAKSLGLTDKNIVSTQFWFKEGSSEEFYVETQSNGAKKKFLVFAKKIDDISRSPFIYYFEDEPSAETQRLLSAQLAALFSLPSPLFVDFFFHEGPSSKKGAVSVFVGAAYLEMENGTWVLKAGKDLLAGENLVLYEFNCYRFAWVKKYSYSHD